MEVLLALYKLPYDPDYPVICYDERPCFLIGETVAPLVMQRGRVRKEHYAYEKLGSCALLAMIEPLTGQRLAQVHPQRTKREYTLFCQAVAAMYPHAIKIRMVQDNLNTHDASAFYENLPADEALALAERFEFYYTPKSASWLNMMFFARENGLSRNFREEGGIMAIPTLLWEQPYASYPLARSCPV